jgi:hypothetical protein
LVLALGGCAARDAGYRITDATTAFVQPGVTTRADVVENLGPPLIEVEGAKVAAYSWGRIRSTGGRAAVTRDTGSPSRRMSYGVDLDPLEETGSVETQRWIYCIEYDADGRVRRAERVRLERVGQSLEQAVRRWAGAAP